MPEAVLALTQYYYAASAGTLVGLDKATSEIVRIRPMADPSVSLENTRTLIVGRFLRFNAAKRILYTESGTEIHLAPAEAEKSRALKEATKVWLASLT